MINHPEGQQILRERPRINTHTVDMDLLAQLPEGTLGREYQRFMTKNNITSDSRAAVQYVDDGELAYVMQRYREVHDFYHCLLGMPTTMLGEVVVKWFEMVNTRFPMCALGAFVGPIRLSPRRRRILREHYIPAVFRTASKSELVLNCYFEKRWEEPIEEVRKDLRLDVIAKPTQNR
ncbi:putative ubiquinone biosynthesis protein COQ4-like, mitochondrial [Apostichopus japonicus]|uniref:Ubiquinone biosynthesis protein COQ4 homolog, mitochondrial n=1 Tax=Stichopus japonicus TaxID=307972 RepID=A0A2G8JSU6_STIJA|nr:putative ubiquinone biosynthesis protein COQ4-like, mitochondrial [Apostichopus japonicus]